MIQRTLNDVAAKLEGISAQGLQDSWTRRSEGVGPYELVDALGASASDLIATIGALGGQKTSAITSRLCGITVKPEQETKIEKYSTELLAGFLIGSYFNQATCARVLSHRETVCDMSSSSQEEACTAVAGRLAVPTWNADPRKSLFRAAVC